MAARAEQLTDGKLEHIVYFKDKRGTIIPIRIMATPGLPTEAYAALAVAQYRGEREGFSKSPLTPTGEVITITGQIDFDPPRPHDEDYR